MAISCAWSLHRDNQPRSRDMSIRRRGHLDGVPARGSGRRLEARKSSESTWWPSCESQFMCFLEAEQVQVQVTTPCFGAGHESKQFSTLVIVHDQIMADGQDFESDVERTFEQYLQRTSEQYLNQTYAIEGSPSAAATSAPAATSLYPSSTTRPLRWLCGLCLPLLRW